MSLSDEDRDTTIEMLAHIYRYIPWGKIRTSKNAWDIWNHRVRHAATRQNLGEFVSRLANHFGLQHVPPSAIHLMLQLEPCESKVLNTIYKEHIPIAMLAAMRAREMKEATDESDDD